ncbi:hypothetical protein BDF22DRAFT_692581 [Syncephalis plumigaleata]|nr:hypothetical protein BDF22DRAFT_692581 [Syncephalis plumigaleata]
MTVDITTNSTGNSARIAVIGSGVTGLAAAWLLKEHSPHQVTLYEADSKLGGHANTVDYEPPAAALETHDAPKELDELQPCPVDTGFIVYNRVTYPNLIRLFAHLEVPVANSDMSFAVSRNQGELEWSGTDVSTVFCQRSNLVSWRFWRMLYDIIRFNWEFTQFATSTQGNYSEGFIDDYLMPMTASVWSTPAEVCAKDFPAWTLARFLHNHRLLQLINHQVHLNCAVESVKRTNDNACRRQTTYDHVIFACHADQSLRILGDSATDAERAELKNFRFERNRAILHCDQELMPKRVHAWSAWNYLSMDVKGKDNVMSLTYWMNRLQNIDPAKHGQIFVTVNPPYEPRKGTVFGEWDYDHPVYTINSVAAQRRLRELPYDRVSFCGAWAGYGFHEDGFRSGMAAAEALGAKSPFGLHDAEYDDFWAKSALWTFMGWLWLSVDVLLRVIPSTFINLAGFGNKSQTSDSNLEDMKED